MRHCRAVAQPADAARYLLVSGPLEKQQERSSDQRQDTTAKHGQQKKLVVVHGFRLRRMSCRITNMPVARNPKAASNKWLPVGVLKKKWTKPS